MTKYTFYPHADGVDIYTEQSSVKMQFLFQPIYQPRTNTVFFYEVLSKVESQSGEIYANDDFFSNIDNAFVKLLAISQLNYVESLPISHSVSINLPLSTLLDALFIQQLLLFSALSFAVEVTALDVNVESPVLKKHINQLKEAGICIWLDDYRTEWKEANDTLGVIPWDFIKIDKTFLHHHNQEIEALHALAFALAPFAAYGLIYEGIETSFENDMIAGVKALAQGYYFGYPHSWKELKQNTHISKNEKVVQDENRHFDWETALLQNASDETQPHPVH